MFESLESRFCLSANPLASASSVGIHMRQEGDTLRIVTFDAHNNITIYREGIYARVDISAATFDRDGNPVTSQQENRYDANKIHKIVIDSGAGDDLITVSRKIKSHVTVYAGAGSDTVSTGSGNDKLFGGPGLDYLYGNGGNDFLDGGEGDDRLIASEGVDDAYGNVGNDRITVLNAGHHIDGGPGRDVATLRDIPSSLKSIERFTDNDRDYIPYASATNAQINGFSRSPSGAVELSVQVGNGVKYACSIDKHLNSGYINVNLLPYRIANADELIWTADIKYQSLTIGNIPAGSYTFALKIGGHEVDRAIYAV